MSSLMLTEIYMSTLNGQFSIYVQPILSRTRIHIHIHIHIGIHIRIHILLPASAAAG